MFLLSQYYTLAFPFLYRVTPCQIVISPAPTPNITETDLIIDDKQFMVNSKACEMIKIMMLIRTENSLVKSCFPNNESLKRAGYNFTVPVITIGFFLQDFISNLL